jgi:hypothetical protein
MSIGFDLIEREIDALTLPATLLKKDWKSS